MNPILSKIKERGHWRINFEPLAYPNRLMSLSECRQLVQRNVVAFRGWDYPHVPGKQEGSMGVFAGENFLEARHDWYGHIEFWRMYQSGQFLQFIALGDDWPEGHGWSSDVQRAQNGALHILGEVVYRFTEIFEFLSRLAKEGIYENGVIASITLVNTKGRQLTTSPDRAFWRSYVTDLDVIPYQRRCSKEEMLSRAKSLATEAIIFFLERFNWANIPVDVIENDQENLIRRRI
jgi:hypothetical protein